MGIVDINWRKVETEALKVIDQDGDKKFDQKDLSILWNKLKKVLLYQLPSSGESRGTQYSHMKGVHARDYDRHQGKLTSFPPRMLSVQVDFSQASVWAFTGVDM
jgi:hypothetical protein